MLIIRGSYHFWPKRVAFRNDYCLRCQAPRRSIAIRTFDVGHLFWNPIFAGWLLETLEMRSVWSGSPHLPEGSPVLQMGRSRFLDCPFLAYVGRPGRYEF